MNITLLNGINVFFTKDKSTHHTHPKSTVYSKVHSWCCIVYGLVQMYNDVCGSAVKNPPAVWDTWETRTWSLGQEDPLEKEMATHSSILAWEILRAEEPGGYSPCGCKKDTVEQLSNNQVGVSLHIVFLEVHIDVYFLISCIPDKIFAVISSLKFIELAFPYKHWRIDAFELWCWRIFLRFPWTTKRSNQFILKEISPGYSLEGLMLKLKLQYFGHLMQRADSLEKTLMLRKTEGRRRRRRQRVRWLDGLTESMDEFEWTPGAGDGQGGLACCSSWGRKESDTTEGQNWTELNKHC